LFFADDFGFIFRQYNTTLSWSVLPTANVSVANIRAYIRVPYIPLVVVW